MKNTFTDTTQLLERARAMRVETAALLTAARVVFGSPASSFEYENIPEEWMSHYHHQVQEKLNILQQYRPSRNDS